MSAIQPFDKYQRVGDIILIPKGVDIFEIEKNIWYTLHQLLDPGYKCSTIELNQLSLDIRNYHTKNSAKLRGNMHYNLIQNTKQSIDDIIPDDSEKGMCLSAGLLIVLKFGLVPDVKIEISDMMYFLWYFDNKVGNNEITVQYVYDLFNNNRKLMIEATADVVGQDNADYNLVIDRDNNNPYNNENDNMDIEYDDSKVNNDEDDEDDNNNIDISNDVTINNNIQNRVNDDNMDIDIQNNNNVEGLIELSEFCAKIPCNNNPILTFYVSEILLTHNYILNKV